MLARTPAPFHNSSPSPRANLILKACGANKGQIMRLGGKKKIQTVILVLFIAIVAYAKETGPDPAHTGAPGELVCTACHDTPSEMPNFGSGSVRVEAAPGNDLFTNSYVPGQTYTLRVTVQHGGRTRFGFQLTALDLDGNRAGTLEPLNTDSQLNPETGANGRQYLQHTESGTHTFTTGSRTWQFRWTAPSTDVGPVRFYVAGNAANGDGTNQNDFIYTSFSTADSPTSKVSVTLQSQPAGQALAAGSKYTINWSATGASNIDNIELRYSTDDGATFPIANQIFFTTDGSVTSFEWTVPDTPTTQGRIRMTVGTKSGAAIDPIITGRFTIIGGGGPIPSTLAISNASVSGKQLFVTGTGFQEGASLYMCSGCATPATEGSRVKKTSVDPEHPGTMLISKKAGKTIERGSTVILQVQNPDGSLSAPFAFTRALE